MFTNIKITATAIKAYMWLYADNKAAITKKIQSFIFILSMSNKASVKHSVTKNIHQEYVFAER